jgi:hypothetical protein
VKKTLILVAPLILFLVYTVVQQNSFHSEKIFNKHKGVCWVGQPQPVSENHLQQLSDLGVNWISQTPFGWQREPHDTALRYESTTQRDLWWGESIKGIAITTRYATWVGIKTVLKPHIWLRSSWPGEIEMKSESDWTAWFRHYEKFILNYAQLADTCGIEILCIGTELQKTIHRKEWISIISKVRSVYQGKLTYAANFNEYEKVPFWNLLDYVGIQAYFPLTNKKNPSANELLAGWEKPLEQLDAFYSKNKKPILFTEIGYKSTDDAGIEPWLWPTHDGTKQLSQQTQANAYTAFFSACWNKEWLAGAYFWKWYPHRPRRSMDEDFSPQGKEAELVLKEWFLKK